MFSVWRPTYMNNGLKKKGKTREKENDTQKTLADGV